MQKDTIFLSLSSLVSALHFFFIFNSMNFSCAPSIHFRPSNQHRIFMLFFLFILFVYSFRQHRALKFHRGYIKIFVLNHNEAWWQSTMKKGRKNKIKTLLRKHLRTVSYTPIYLNLKEICNQTRHTQIYCTIHFYVC